jgi:hypothetical protein
LGGEPIRGKTGLRLGHRSSTPFPPSPRLFEKPACCLRAGVVCDVLAAIVGDVST